MVTTRIRYGFSSSRAARRQKGEDDGYRYVTGRVSVCRESSMTFPFTKYYILYLKGTRLNTIEILENIYGKYKKNNALSSKIENVTFF